MSLTASQTKVNHRGRKAALALAVVFLPLAAATYYFEYNTGTVTVLITDDAIADFRTLNITFSEVALHSTNAVSATPWMGLRLETTSVDLKALTGNLTVILGLGKVPAATYTQVRIVVTSAAGVLKSGQNADVRVPSGELRTETPFTLQPMGETTLIMRLLVVNPGGGYQLQPALGSIESG